VNDETRYPNPWRWLIPALVLMGVCIVTALVLLYLQGKERGEQIDALVSANLANEKAVEELCEKKPNDPTCEKAERIPDTSDIVDEAEIQEPEIDDPDPNDPEIQEPEIQDPEDQNQERQDAEDQDAEIQNDEINDPDPVDDPDPNDPDPDDPDPNDPDPDDPDPNSMLQFAVDDSCTPPDGEVITNVGLDVRRSEGVVTYVITCTSAPATPGQGGTP
jgi:hypothetical protein